MASRSEQTGCKVNVSSGKDCPPEIKGQTKVITLEVGKNPLIGKKVGENFNGALIGLPGYELKITGGSDDSGIPIRGDVHGPVKKFLLLSGGIGYKPQRNGERKRKVVRGNEITDNMTQINTIVMKFGKEKLFGPKEASEKEKAEKSESKPKKTAEKKDKK
jgi:small subunit ribosomal protein S6e